MKTFVRFTADNTDDKKRGWCTVLWCDNENDMRTFEIIKNMPSALWIIHDKDFDENNSPKKKHIHVVFKFENGRYGKAVCKQLNLEPYRLEVLASESGILKYLIHLDEPDKHKYDIDEIHGSDALLRKLRNILDRYNKSEESRVLEIIQFIDSCDRVLTMKDILLYCCDRGKYNIFRQCQYTWRVILNEHNALYE